MKYTYKEKKAKREKQLGFVKLFDNPFPKEIKINWHHVNNIFVIPIPEKLHKCYYGSNRYIHRTICNKKLIDIRLLDKIFGLVA